MRNFSVDPPRSFSVFSEFLFISALPEFAPLYFRIFILYLRVSGIPQKFVNSELRASIRPRGLVSSAQLWGFLILLAQFSCCVRVWATGVEVAGSIPEGSILSQMLESVNAIRVMRLHMNQRLISHVWGSNVGIFPYRQGA